MYADVPLAETYNKLTNRTEATFLARRLVLHVHVHVGVNLNLGIGTHPPLGGDGGDFGQNSPPAGNPQGEQLPLTTHPPSGGGVDFCAAGEIF